MDYIYTYEDNRILTKEEVIYLIDNGTTKGTGSNIDQVSNGTYIVGTDNKCYEYGESWVNRSSSVDVLGIGLKTSKCAFIIALSDAHPTPCDWGANVILSNVRIDSTYSDESIHEYDGESMTTAIITAQKNNDTYAANKCRSFTFPVNKIGYMGSEGEWQQVIDNKNTINTLLTAVGGTNLSSYYWTATQYSADSAICALINDSYLLNRDKSSSRYVRAFAAF